MTEKSTYTEQDRILSTFRHAKIEGLMWKLDQKLSLVLKELRTTKASTTSSEAVRPTAMDMRSWQKIMDLGAAIFEYIIPLLRYLGPWAWLIITSIAAMVTSWWKGVVPYLNGLLGG